MAAVPRTLLEKIWDEHEVIAESADAPAVLYIDLHLIHEVTSPQAFAVLGERGLAVRRPELTLATLDHSTPTRTEQIFGGAPIAIESAAQQIRALERNCALFGVELLGLKSAERGIVHVIGPEQDHRMRRQPHEHSRRSGCPRLWHWHHRSGPRTRHAISPAEKAQESRRQY